MMFPVPVPVPDPFGLPRMRQLERALVSTLDTIQALLERLEAKFGLGFLGSDLSHMTAAGKLADWQREVAEIDRYITDRHPSTAVRHFHDRFGFNWDEAQLTVQRWSYYLPGDKLRTVRLAQFIKAIDQEPGSLR